jgi:hypothetical protein
MDDRLRQLVDLAMYENMYRDVIHDLGALGTAEMWVSLPAAGEHAMLVFCTQNNDIESVVLFPTVQAANDALKRLIALLKLSRFGG